MIDHEKVIEIIRQKGPIVPSQLAPIIKENSIILGAVLSSLAAQKKVVISSLKVGGSPLYYLPSQSAQLEGFTRYLNEKDQASAIMLKEKKVMRESDMTPLMRVCMKNIKDFAKPLEVKIGDRSEIFWKYYLVSDDEASKMISSILEPAHLKQTGTVQEKPAAVKQHEADGHQEESVEIGDKKESAEPEKPKKREKKPKEEDFILTKEGPQINDAFHAKLLDYFQENKITVKEAKLLKRNSEMDYLIEVPSAVGSIEYYCKAKSKKTINEGDLATAFVRGQVMKHPVLFISTGSLTKRAEEMLQKEFKGMKIIKVGK